LLNKQGKLLGMVTSNLKVVQQSLIVGKVNFSLPVNILQPLWESIQKDEAISDIENVTGNLWNTAFSNHDKLDQSKFASYLREIDSHSVTSKL